MKFLINPGGNTMAKTPPRDSKGRFISKNKARKSRKRKSRKRARRARNQPRDALGRFVSKSRSRSRRSYRSNPVGGDVLAAAQNGAMTAVKVVAGKAAVRSLPNLVGIDQPGNVGVAIRAATAVAIGLAADRFVDAEMGADLMAGGLASVIEDLAVAYSVPWLGPALAAPPGISVSNGGGNASGYPSRMLGAGSYPKRLAGYPKGRNGRGGRARSARRRMLESRKRPSYGSGGFSPSMN